MTKYIAIDGKGGSGKTYLAGLLAEKLHANVYHLDDYGNDYQPFVGLPKLREVVAEATGEVIIYEGVGVFDERFDTLQPFRILVQVPDDIRNEWATGRDVPRQDRSAEDWKNIWAIWNAVERAYFTEIVAKKADMIVGVQNGEFDIEEIVMALSTG